MKSKSQSMNENGSVLIFTLLILILVTIAGISGLNTTDMEMVSSMNTVTHKQNLYAAEGATNQGARLLSNLADTPSSFVDTTYPWLQSTSGSHSDTAAMDDDLEDLRDSSTWTDPTDANPNNVFGIEANTTYRIMDFGVAMGGTLGLNAPSTIKHDYVVMGRYNSTDGAARRGEIIVEKAYRLRVE